MVGASFWQYLSTGGGQQVSSKPPAGFKSRRDKKSMAGTWDGH